MNQDVGWYIPFEGRHEDLGFRVGSVMKDLASSPLLLVPVAKLASAGPPDSMGILPLECRGQPYFLAAMRLSPQRLKSRDIHGLARYRLGEYASSARLADDMGESLEDMDIFGEDTARFQDYFPRCGLLNCPEEAGRMAYGIIRNIIPGFVPDEAISISALALHLLDRLMKEGRASVHSKACGAGLSDEHGALGVAVCHADTNLELLPLLLLNS